MKNTHISAPYGRRGIVALGVSALLVGGLAGCDSAGPEEGASVEDVSEGDEVTTPEETVTDGYIGPYSDEFGDSTDYVGQTVELSAEVNSVLSEQAFTIGDAVGLEPLLITSAEGVTDLEEGEGVRVTGVVMENFAIADFEEEWGVDLDDEEWGDFEGENYVQADSVETGVDFEDE